MCSGSLKPFDTILEFASMNFSALAARCALLTNMGEHGSAHLRPCWRCCLCPQADMWRVSTSGGRAALGVRLVL